MTDLRDAPSALSEWVDSLLEQAAEKPRAKERHADNRVALRTFARTLHFALRVPGAHPNGPAYDTLLGYLAAQGRPFAADSSKLRDHVAYVLIEQFGDAKRAPGAAQLRQFAAAAILEWVLARLESGQRDVPIAPNAPAYRAWKRKHANYSRPGMSSGALRDAIRDKGRVTVR